MLLEEAERLSRALQQQFAATASAMGLSLTQLVRVLAIVVPKRCLPSRAMVGRWVEQSSSRAGRILQVLDRACQAWVVTLCLDAIFVHREPVFVAVDADSLAWMAGQRGPDRTGASWCRVLQQWPGLARVVRDAGPGLARGVKLLNEARTLHHLDWIHEQLAQAVPAPLVREAVVRLWYWRRDLVGVRGTHQRQAVQMVIMAQLLCRRLSSEWPQAYARVGYILSHTVRASSAVECMNRVLRIPQARHRQVSQGM